jgi:LmbE family N-acetylglucosaminyl deacetylase
MQNLALTKPGERLNVLCLGAHSDDIEIGAGGTLLAWMAAGVKLNVTWVVFSAPGERGAEAKASAEAFLAGAAQTDIVLQSFRDSFFPYQGSEIKSCFHQLARLPSPDVVLTHRLDDAHQDHREISQLTWNTFRNHLILEYEIPKWDGDLGKPNIYMPVAVPTMERKIAMLMEHFGTQRSKDWFDAETFRGLARLRGMECRAPDGYAEAFTIRKALLS